MNLRPPTSSHERAVKPTEHWSTHSLFEDNFESSFNICRVFHVHRVYVGLSDGLCIRMLGRHLWKQRWSVKTVQLIHNLPEKKKRADGGLWQSPPGWWACPWRSQSSACSVEGPTWGSGKHSHWPRLPRGRGLHREKTGPPKPESTRKKMSYKEKRNGKRKGLYNRDIMV